LPILLRGSAACGQNGLLAFPAQSNFSGVQHPLSLVTSAQALGFDVLLDAASYLPAHALSLRRHPATFVALSFYKMFGYPTGVGALIARRDALARLERPWFAGGTVAYASVELGTFRRREGHDGFEDGTPNFLAIAALDAGFIRTAPPSSMCMALAGRTIWRQCGIHALDIRSPANSLLDRRSSCRGRPCSRPWRVFLQSRSVRNRLQTTRRRECPMF
jgi:hypothetical protein